MKKINKICVNSHSKKDIYIYIRLQTMQFRHGAAFIAYTPSHRPQISLMNALNNFDISFCYKMTLVTSTRQKDIPSCHEVQKRVVKLWMIHGSLPMLDNFKRTHHVLRKKKGFEN